MASGIGSPGLTILGAALLIGQPVQIAAQQRDPCRFGRCDVVQPAPGAANPQSQREPPPQEPETPASRDPAGGDQPEGQYPEGRQEPDGREQEPRPEREKSGGFWEAVIIGAGAIGTVVLLDSMTGGDLASAKALEADGPRLPRRLPGTGRFQAQGFANAGWPVTIELDTLPGTTTWLEVWSEGDDKPWAAIMIPGEGRRTHRVVLPGGDALVSPPPRPARYAIHSAIVTPGSNPVYQPLEIYMIAAGPRVAVAAEAARAGSLFRRAAFQPGPPLRQLPSLLRVDNVRPDRPLTADDVRFSLQAGRFFTKSATEVMGVPRKAGEKFQEVSSVRSDPLAAGNHNRDWRSMGVRPKKGRLFQIQARAWLAGGANDERDWIGAYAPRWVTLP